MIITERIVVTMHTDHERLGTFRGATVDRKELLSDGRLIDAGQHSLSASDVNEAIATLNADAISQLSTVTAERDTALSDKANLQDQLDSANAMIESLQSDKAALETTNTELQTSVSTLTGERDTAVSELTTANERIAILESRIAELTAEPEVAIVSRRQARLALLEMGLFEQVESAVYDGPKAVQIEYEADAWRRDNATLVAMAKSLGMSEEQIDQFFALAGSK